MPEDDDDEEEAVFIRDSVTNEEEEEEAVFIRDSVTNEEDETVLTLWPSRRMDLNGRTGGRERRERRERRRRRRRRLSLLVSKSQMRIRPTHIRRNTDPNYSSIGGGRGDISSRLSTEIRSTRNTLNTETAAAAAASAAGRGLSDTPSWTLAIPAHDFDMAYESSASVLSSFPPCCSLFVTGRGRGGGALRTDFSAACAHARPSAQVLV